MTLSDLELSFIKEEEDTLRRLQVEVADQIKDTLRDDIIREIAELSDAIPHANSDDLPQVKAQLSRLDAVLKHIDSVHTGTLDVMNPYFGHMRLADGSGIKDLYLGSQIYRSTTTGIQIIDWKTSPIARIYFLYEDGDAYEEEIEGRLFEGEIVFKRILRIVEGRIQEIQSGDRRYIKHRSDQWEAGDANRYLLRGGAGSAPRPLNTSSIKPGLGAEANDTLRSSKYLPEITGLIDPNQFELITQPESGVVAIQGVAGSGKTTVALHRVAWLHFQDPERFQAERMLVMVFNKALATYVSKVLPSLGVPHVQIEYYESWISQLRSRLYSGHLPRKYNEHTPVSAIRFKKHPVLFQLIDRFIEQKESQLDSVLSELNEQQPYREILTELMALPLITKVYTVYEWLEGKRLIQHCDPSIPDPIKNRLFRAIHQLIDPEKDRMQTLLEYWEDLFTNYGFLLSAFKAESDDLSSSQLDETFSWLKKQFSALSNKEQVSRKDLVEIMGDVQHSETPDIVLDAEDDPILVYLYQRLLKPIDRKNRKRLQFEHIMIDEVQDFSPVELAVLLNMAKDPLSLTLAGDVNQKIIRESGFKTWETTFSSLGIKGQKVSALRIGYRSTYEIMEFAFSILGDLSDTREFIATRHGPPVESIRFSNQGELIQFLSRGLIETLTYEPMASVAVICPTPESSREYYDLMKNLEIPDLRLIADQDFPFEPGVDVTDVRQVKGLEFDYVVMLDVDNDHYPNDRYSRFLLHVAASRAAHQLWILNHRSPSPLLPAS